MSTMQHFGGYAMEATWLKRMAQELGMSTAQLMDSDPDIFSFLLSHSEPQPGRLEGVFRGGLTMLVDYTVGTGGAFTVRRVETRLDGQTESVWSGNMTLQQFVSDFWPETRIEGSAHADWLSANQGTTVLGNGGNDIIELWGGVAAGGAGVDTFVIGGLHGNMTIRDFQLGDKVVFGMFDSIAELVANVRAVTPAAGGGFTVGFGGHAAWTQFTVTFENFALAQLRMEDVLVGLTGLQTAYTPLAQAFGIDPHYI